MSQSTPRPDTIGKLPVLSTVAGAYRAVVSRFGSVIKATIAPYILSLVLVGIAIVGVENIALGGAIIWLNLAPFTLAGVALYRLMLLGPVAGAPSLLPRWTWRHWCFLGYVVAVLLISQGAGFALVFLAESLGLDSANPDPFWPLAIFSAIVFCSYLIARLSFVFPATAVDETYSLRESWSHTKRQGFRLLGAIVLMIVVIYALFSIVFIPTTLYLLTEFGESIVQKGIPPTRMEKIPEEIATILFIGSLIMMVFNYFLMALMVSVVSIAFRACTGWQPEVSTPPPESEAGN